MKKGIRNLLIVLCLLIAGVCVGFIALTLMNRQRNEQIYDEVKEQVKTTTAQTQETQAETRESVTKETVAGADGTVIDFDALTAINPDIYAWIEIPGTRVDYPIAQSPTNDYYYLNHTIEGAEGYPGSIYTERKNHKDFSDFNTLIYGHDMNDGSMFKGLHDYEDLTFMQENPYVYIYRPEGRLTYRIFAAVVYDDRHILLTYDFSKDEDRQAFLDSLDTGDERNVFDDSVEVTADDRIITLSTCIGDESTHRFLVGAVLTDEE